MPLKAGSEANCSLTNANTGQVEAIAVDLSSTKTCTIVGIASRTGYTSKTGDISINLSPGVLTISNVGSFTGNLVVGASALSPSAPTTAPTGASFRYALKQGEGDCTLNDPVTGEAQANPVAVTSGTTACTLVVTASLTGYASVTGDVSVNLEEGTLVFATNTSPAYPSTSIPLSGTLETSAIPTTDDNNIAVSWSFAAAGTRGENSQSGVCTVDNDSSSTTFGDITAGSSVEEGDICQITITATASTLGYQSWSEVISLDARELKALEISVGGNSSCVRFAGGRIKCWGENVYGQLGYGDYNHRGDSSNEMGASLPFVDLGVGRTAVQTASGEDHTCAILDNGSLKCWGKNGNGQLGGGTSDRTQPPLSGVYLGMDRTAIQVDTEGNYTCAILDNGSLVCWGENNYGQLGNGSTDDSSSPITVNLGQGRTASQVTTSFGHACAILDNASLKCWGANILGQLGDGSTNDSLNPITVDLGQGRTATHVAASGNYTCAILDNSSLKCWGVNRYGQLGTSEENDSCLLSDNTSFNCRKNPTLVNLGVGKTAKMVAAGGDHTCAILNDNSLKCWGRNNVGQLGQGNATDQGTPAMAIDFGTDRTVRSAALGHGHACAILDDYNVKCWGKHTNASLGTGSGSAIQWGDNPREMGDFLPTVALLEDLKSQSVTAPTYTANLTIGNSSGVAVTTSPVTTDSATSTAVDGATYSYWSEGKRSGTVTDDICSVDATTGEVTLESAARADDTCEITVVSTLLGYSPTTATATLTVQAGTRAYTWSQSATTATFGTTVSLSSVDEILPDGASLYYEVVSGDTNTAGCTISGRTVIFADDGSCQVRIRVTQENYVDYISAPVTIIVNPLIWTSAPAWTGYSGSNTATFGTVAPIIETPTSTPNATWNYSTATISICSVDSQTGALSIIEPGSCVVTATPMLVGYGTHPGLDITISIAKGTQNAIIWGSFSGWLRPGGVTKTPPTPAGVGASEADSITYELKSSTSANCTLVDANTGEVRANAVSFDLVEGSFPRVNCIVIGTARRTNYVDNISGDISIKLLPGFINDVAWTGYSSNTVTYGDVVPTLNEPTSTTVGVTWVYSTITSNSICTVNSNTGALTIIGVGSCVVTVTPTKTGYAHPGVTFTLLIGKAANPGSTTVADHYADRVFLGVPINPSNSLPSDGEGVLEYRVFDGAAIDSGSASTNCIVGSAGEISGVRGGVGQVCYIHVRWAGNENYLQSVWFNISGNDGITVLNPNPLQIVAGRGHNCVRFEGGGLKCWGHGDVGQLGYGNTDNRGDDNSEMGVGLPWVNLSDGTKMVVTNERHTCAILDDNFLKCWGKNEAGQLGDGSTTDRHVPVTINLGMSRTVKVVSTGDHHTCAILDDDSLKCWGKNGYGQLGDGSAINQHTPVSINLGTGRTAKAITLGRVFTCAILDDDSLKCWGNNSAGELGTGETSSFNTPPADSINLGVARTAKAVSAGDKHVCAILDDDSLKCWGDNQYGQLGDGSTTDNRAPVAINLGAGRTAKAISLGGDHTCAILDDDSLKCWGKNGSGRLGDGSITNRNAPVAINLGTNKSVKMVAMGIWHTCAMLNDDTVKCWGGNYYGSLGAGANPDTESSDPIIWGDGSGEMGDNLPMVDLL